MLLAIFYTNYIAKKKPSKPLLFGESFLENKVSSIATDFLHQENYLAALGHKKADSECSETALGNGLEFEDK